MSKANLESLVTVSIRLLAVYLFVITIFGIIPFIQFIFESKVHHSNLQFIKVQALISIIYLIITFVLWHFSSKLSSKILFGLDPNSIELEVEYNYLEKIALVITGLIIIAGSIPEIFSNALQLYLSSDLDFQKPLYAGKLVGYFVLFVFGSILIIGKDRIQKIFLKLRKISKAT